MKIKILVLNIDDVGGIERVAFNMFNMFKKDKLLSNVEIVSVNGKMVSSGVSILDGSSENNKLYDFAKSIDSDTIVLSLYDRLTIKLSFIRKVKRKLFKLYACQHADYYAHRVSTRILRRISYRWVDKIIALTVTDFKFYQRFFSDVHIIPNVLGYYPISALSQDKRSIDCAAAGRLVPVKQYDHYYQFLNKVQKIKENGAFRLYGDGPKANDLINILESIGISSKDVQVGVVDDIYSELNKTKFFFVTSERESFSMVILEAMACGCVVISYDCPTGPRELIDDGVNGFLVKANDVSGLVDCYTRLLDNVELCQSISDSARATALNYLESNIIIKWKDICEQ
ncbi:glycosyltransferase [Vibrio cyclitrophicus]|uniref:glycosyltransferase n=1 Tax=Vibrio cyclitrophicus TaxID=47951 RepID=UPI000C81F352|nr:glycosyltransferase [Vibrio cyclitrophicus]PMH74636.1 hypothetical protein BCU59_02395 [Vibrio cyclitrophicus]